MGWQLKNGQLYFNEILITDSTIVLAAENKENKLINGVQLQPPSTDLPNISFSCCHFYSSVEAMVYTPKIKETKVPYFVYVVTDPNFKKHEYPFPITADYLICDNLFLLLDDSVVNATKELQEIIIPGRVDYGKLPLLYKSRNDILHFVQDDLKCPSFEKKEISAPSSGITLYPYQVNGVSWMASVVSEGVGCVLADEMGLGKTFQIIALLECEKEHGISLVVAPGALLDNWKREFLKLAPRMSVLIHRGNKRLRYYKEFLGYDVIIVSYDTVKVDFSVFSQIVWNILVIDEAQSIKNQGSMRSQIIREFRKRAGIAVTGTPFENHVTDIWSIYDFCYRDLLGTSSQFKKQFIDDEKSAETLERIITPLLLRRLVKDVKKELPEKVLVSTPISMEESEAEYYEMIRKNNTFSSTGSNLGAINK
jgi:SNF2 family DNA or RNA helicase